MFHSVKSRITVTFLVTLVVAVAITSFISFRLVHWYEHSKTDDDGVSAARACADMFEFSMAARAPFENATSLVDATCCIVDDFAEGCEQIDDLTAVALTRCSADEIPSDFTEAAGQAEAAESAEGGGPAEAADAAKAAREAAIAGLTETAELTEAAKLIEVAPEIASFGSIRSAIFATEASDSTKRKACLACEETFANIVSYSGADTVWFTAESIAEGLRVTLADNGTPFDPTAAASPDKAFEDLDSGGMGIALVRQIAKDLQYHRANGRNVLTILISSDE